jgi:hypothetical protein
MNRTQPPRLCVCGCGTPVRHRWAKGHNRRGAVVVVPEPWDGVQKFCACGCGEPVRSWPPSRAQKYADASHRNRKWTEVPEPVWDGDCLRWRGTIGRAGYGQYGKPATRIHRLVWELFVGPIAAGMTLDHVYDRGCRFRDCIRITHLEEVSWGENARRGQVIRGRINQTHCKRGHEFTPDNTIWGAGKNSNCRGCRTCAKERELARTARRKEQRLAAGEQPSKVA